EAEGRCADVPCNLPFSLWPWRLCALCPLPFALISYSAYVIRQTVARVDLEALAANVATLRVLLDEEQTPPGIIAVVKANAYGHGAVAVARRLEQAGVDILACADIEEGIELRTAGIAKPILVFGALSLSDLDGVFEFDLTPTVSTPTAAEAVEQAGAARGAV